MKTKIKRMLPLILTLCLVVPLVFPITTNAAVKLSGKYKVLGIGQTYQLKVTGTKKEVKWSSANTKIATVDSKGNIKAIAKGKTSITAKVGQEKYKCTISVCSPRIASTNYFVQVGKTIQIAFLGDSKNITWESSNKEVISISSSGTATGLRSGEVTITATVGQKKYTCSISSEYKYGYLDKKISYDITEDSEYLYIKLTNSSNTHVNITSSVILKDAKETTIYRNSPETPISPNDFNILCVSKPENYSSYSFSIGKVVDNGLLIDFSVVSKLSFKSEIKLSQNSLRYLFLNINNNSNKDIEYLSFDVVFFKDGKPILTYNSYVSKLYGNSIMERELFENLIEFDDFKVIVKSLKLY